MKPLPIEQAKPLVYSVPNYQLVQSLPYADDQYDNHEAKKLIQQEMSTFDPVDYLALLPDPNLTLIESDYIKGELRRVFQGEEIQRSSYEHVDLPTENDSKEEWVSKIDKLKIAAQYMEYKKTSSELLKQHGFKVWEKNVKLISDSTDIVKFRNKEIKDRIQEINSKRQYEQALFKERESELHKSYINQLKRNTSLEVELAKHNILTGNLK